MENKNEDKTSDATADHPNREAAKTIKFVIGENGTHFTVTGTVAAADYIQGLVEKSWKLQALAGDPTFPETKGCDTDAYVRMVNGLFPDSQLARTLSDLQRDAIWGRQIERELREDLNKKAAIIRELSFRAQAWDTVVALLAKIR